VLKSGRIKPLVDISLSFFLKQFDEIIYTSTKQRPLIPWTKIFDLQNQDGFWELSSELFNIWDLDVYYLINVSLAKKGIQSLGPKGKEKLLQLIATLLVLQLMQFTQLEGLTFKSLMKLNDSSPSRCVRGVRLNIYTLHAKC
uniref:PARP4 MVP-ID C-terminal domain-containing protein n=1 Tax=Sphenodon punctatus TaxID=8508 RepID=A0A8D0L6H5_SPHPU